MLEHALVGTVGRIATAFDLPFDADAVVTRATELASQRRRHEWSRSQWGLTEAQVREALASYS